MNTKPNCPGECTAKVAVLENQMNTVEKALHEINGKLDAVLIQTTKTNGRVDRLEKDVGENFHGDRDINKRVTELERGSAKLWLLISVASSVVAMVAKEVVSNIPIP